MQFILNAVLGKLESFFPEYQIYQEQADQETDGSYFLVYFENIREKEMIGNRYGRELTVTVEYHNQNGISEAQAAEQLLVCLDTVSLDDGSQLKGTQKNGVRKEGILYCRVNYNVMGIRSSSETELMQDLVVKQ